jgi:hypothetical protein
LNYLKFNPVQMKQFLLTLLCSAIMMDSQAQTLQKVTDTGRVSIRNDDNIILQKASGGPGRLYLQYNNQDGTVRGTIGYTAGSVNNFNIYNVDNSPIFLQNRVLVNNPPGDDSENGLQVKSGLAIYGSNNNTGNHIRFKRSGGQEMAYIGWQDESQLNTPFMIKSSNGNDILFSVNTNELMRITTGGSVGIGTNDPLQKLDVRGSLLLETGANPGLFTGTGNTDLNRYLMLLNSPTASAASGLKAGGVLIADTYAYADPGKNDLVVKGNVAIGVSSATARLQVTEGMQTMKFCTGTNTSGYDLNMGANDDGVNFSNNSTSRGFNFKNANGTLVSINAGGNVGIGTTSPGNYKLAVEGTIGARRVKVTKEMPWADFVFRSDYKLPTLAQVEAFIMTDKHLPGIPTEKEVDQHGIDLGDMNTRLLQKVEELTLYLIEQNKKITTLEEEVKELKKKKRQ